MSRRPIVTFTSDFGAGSGYPAQMKAVVLCALPDAQLVDVSHEVPQYDVLAGALLLEACAPRFPLDAVHVAVVDPGVGTARRALSVVDAAGRRFVAPDNGLLTPFLDAARCVEIVPGGVAPRPGSATFHGRDLFAPVAAWLAGGGDPARLGPEITDPVRIAWPRAERRGDEVHGECLTADPFGNVVTSVRAEDLGWDQPLTPTLSPQARRGSGARGITPSPRERSERGEGWGEGQVTVGRHTARLVRTFGEGERGELLAMIGSGGRLELAVREGSAAARLGPALRGLPVVVRAR